MQNCISSTATLLYDLPHHPPPPKKRIIITSLHAGFSYQGNNPPTSSSSCLQEIQRAQRKKISQPGNGTDI
jgi:hypothetical protein